MEALTVPSRMDALTFKGNLKDTRYGWLRLTPAYSLHAISDRIPRRSGASVRVLDPFSGTGTTALVCAERGIACDGVDINPFLIWLARAKTRSYSAGDILAFRQGATQVRDAIRAQRASATWLPPIHKIEKWWDDASLECLGSALAEIRLISTALPSRVGDLMQVAFCRLVIETAYVSFGHQSMSFRKPSGSGASRPLVPVAESVGERWRVTCASLAESAASDVPVEPQFYLGDARYLTSVVPTRGYSTVVTSPPYPNRMSYIRELRPYMYWLGFLKSGEAASDLDWAAIGGTWGSATSKLAAWRPEGGMVPVMDDFERVLARIRERSPLLANYVQKYFIDMAQHCRQLFDVVSPGGQVTYIVGNSKFYDVLLPVEAYFGQLFLQAGFERVRIVPLRKRTSKPELFEYAVSCGKPA